MIILVSKVTQIFNLSGNVDVLKNFKMILISKLFRTQPYIIHIMK